MALTLFWRCEGATLDGSHDYSAGDAVATANGSTTLDAAAAKIGSNGILINASSERYSFDPASIISTSVGSIGFWVRFVTSMPGAPHFYFYCRGTNSNDYLTIASVGTGGQVELQLRNNVGGLLPLSTASGTVDANMAADQWYFITASWDIANDDRRIRVYNSSGTLIQHHEDTSTDLASYEPANFTTGGLQIGDTSGWGATIVGHYDNIFIGSAYDDADTFAEKRDIASYADYAGGSSNGAAVYYYSQL